MKPGLAKDMEPIGKAMLRGSFQQMAHRFWQHKLLKPEVMKYVLRSIAAECSSLFHEKLIYGNTV